MGLMNDDDSVTGGSLYGCASSSVGDVSASGSGSGAAGGDTQQNVDPQTALVSAAELVANPSGLLSDVFPSDPRQSKLPMPLAVLGLCVVGMIWANWVEGGRKWKS